MENSSGKVRAEEGGPRRVVLGKFPPEEWSMVFPGHAKHTEKTGHVRAAIFFPILG